MPYECPPKDDKTTPAPETPLDEIKKAHEVTTAIEKTGEEISLAGELEALKRYAKKHTKDPEAEKIGLFFQQLESVSSKKISKAKREVLLETYAKDAGALLSEIKDKVGPEEYKKLLEGEQDKEAKERSKPKSETAWDKLKAAAGPHTRAAMEKVSQKGEKALEDIKAKFGDFLERRVERKELGRRDEMVASSKRDIETCERDVASTDERIRKEREGIANGAKAVEAVRALAGTASKEMLEKIERERISAEARIEIIEHEREMAQARLAGLREAHATWEGARDAIAQKFVDHAEKAMAPDRITIEELKLKQSGRDKEIKFAEGWVDAYKLDIQKSEANIARNPESRIDLEGRVAQDKKLILELERSIKERRSEHERDQRRLDEAERRVKDAEKIADKYIPREKRDKREKKADASAPESMPKAPEGPKTFNNGEFAAAWNELFARDDRRFYIRPETFIKFMHGETEVPAPVLENSFKMYIINQRPELVKNLSEKLDALRKYIYERSDR